MALINITPIQDGTTAQASQVNTPLQTIVDEFNGNISSVNLANGAVTTNKLGDGEVTPAKLSPIAFHATFPSQANTNGEFTKLNATAVVQNNGGAYDGSSATFTAPHTGLYFFKIRSAYAGSNTNDRAFLALSVNDSVSGVTSRDEDLEVTAVRRTLGASFVKRLQEGDEVEAFIFRTTTTGAYDTSGSFSGFLVAKA